MELLLKAPVIIPQIIMSLCAVSIVTYNKLSEIMMPFHGGNKVRSRINVTTGKKAFNWLFDTGAAITCMNADSFWESFGHSKPRLLKKSAGCIAANGSKMDSMGIYEIEMNIRGRKFLHPVTVVEELNDNILGIDFMHQHKLNYDATSKQITLAHMLTNALYAVKEVTIPAISSMMVTTKYKGLTSETAQPIATIHAPQHPTISGMPAWVTLDNYKNCKFIIDNCAPYDILLPRNEILGVLEFEAESCLPLDENTVASIISNIEEKFPKVQKKHFSRAEIEQKANLNVPHELKQKYVDILHKHQAAISMNKMDLGCAKNFTHKIDLQDNNPVHRKQFKIPEAHQNFIETTLDEWLKLGVVK
jgi:hypothetical protein